MRTRRVTTIGVVAVALGASLGASVAAWADSVGVGSDDDVDVDGVVYAICADG
jgi:hypothetical protein